MAPGACERREQDHNAAFVWSDLRPLRAPAQDDELLPEQRILGEQLAATPGEIGQKPWDDGGARVEGAADGLADPLHCDRRHYASSSPHPTKHAPVSRASLEDNSLWRSGSRMILGRTTQVARTALF